MQLVSQLDPDGAKQRKCRRLKRRTYCCRVCYAILSKVVYIFISVHIIMYFSKPTVMYTQLYILFFHIHFRVLMRYGILTVMTSYACMAFSYMVALMGKYFTFD